MNVKELRELISDLPEDAPVIIASDEEGNSFHALDGWSVSAFAQSGYEFEVFDDDPSYENDPKALVLWP